jgi:hypothetical protein
MSGTLALDGIPQSWVAAFGARAGRGGEAA